MLPECAAYALAALALLRYQPTSVELAINPFQACKERAPFHIPNVPLDLILFAPTGLDVTQAYVDLSPRG